MLASQACLRRPRIEVEECCALFMIRLTTPIHFSHSYLSVSSSRVAPVPQLSEATFCSANQAADRGWGIAEGGSDDRAMTDHDLFVTDRDRPAALRRSFDRFDCRAPREGERETAKNRQFTRLTGRAAPPMLRPRKCLLYSPGLDALVAFPLSFNYLRSASLSLSRISIADTA